jgi:hypothetical protein
MSQEQNIDLGSEEGKSTNNEKDINSRFLNAIASFNQDNIQDEKCLTEILLNILTIAEYYKIRIQNDLKNFADGQKVNTNDDRTECSLSDREKNAIMPQLERMSKYLIVQIIKNKQNTDSDINDSVNIVSALKAVIKFLTQYKDNAITFHNWSHTACHLVEHYGREQGSLLDDEELHPSLTLIVDEVIKRLSESNNKYANTGRIIGPIIKYNEKLLEQQLQEDKLDNHFPYKPESLNQVIDDKNVVETAIENLYNDRIKSDGDQKIILFIQANSPIEYYTSIIEKKIKLSLSPKNQLMLLKYLVNNMGLEKEVEEYVKRIYNINNKEINYQDLIINFESYLNSTEKEITKGVYVDVEGTLLVNRGYSENIILNTEVVKHINSLIKENPGKEVIIFTGGDTENLKNQLQELGLQKELGRVFTVQPKANYVGQNLEYLIDDTPSEYQGFYAQKLINPEDLGDFI